MKKLLILLFSLFFLSSYSVFAKDISDFEIEGISIGDSLLDYMTEDEILKNIESRKDDTNYLKEPDKYLMIVDSFTSISPAYDHLYFFIKNNSANQYVTDKNEKFTILYVGGYIKFVENFEGCIKKRDEISEILSGMFPNEQKTEWTGDYNPPDPSGKSISDSVTFKFSSGADIFLQCLNIEETFRIKKNWTEGLSVAITSAEVKFWLQDTKWHALSIKFKLPYVDDEFIYKDNKDKSKGYILKDGSYSKKLRIGLLKKTSG